MYWVVYHLSNYQHKEVKKEGCCSRNIVTRVNEGSTWASSNVASDKLAGKASALRPILEPDCSLTNNADSADIAKSAT